MINELKINLSPSKNELKTIKKWLFEESRNTDEGFYYNWYIIEKAFEEMELFTLNINDNAIGFAVWHKSGYFADIDIFEINLENRKKGIGNYFYNEIEQVFKNHDIKAIKLFCSPRVSEFFWRKMGFIKFPNIAHNETDLNFYKPLVEVKVSTHNPNEYNKLELWDIDFCQGNTKKPLLSWNIESEPEKFNKPIIQPCNMDWWLRWTKNGKIVKEHIVKRFSNSDNRIEFSPFMYIEKLIE